MTTATRLIVFDLGGVVVRICRSWGQGCAAAGIEDRNPPEGCTDAAHAERAALSRAYHSGHIACDAYFQGVARTMGGAHTPDDVRLVHDAWVLSDYPGIEALIRAINATPALATACLSNTNHRHWITMRGELDPARRSRAFHAITHAHASHLIGAVKPDHDIYRAFEHVLETPPSRIMFFDDLPENIDAARSLGWDAHAIDHTADTAAQVRAYLRHAGIALSESAAPG